MTDFIFFSDWKLESIVRVNKHGGNELTLRKGVEYLRDVMVYDQSIQKKPGKSWVELTLRKGVEFLRDVMVYDQSIQKKTGKLWVEFFFRSSSVRKKNVFYLKKLQIFGQNKRPCFLIFRWSSLCTEKWRLLSFLFLSSIHQRYSSSWTRLWMSVWYEDLCKPKRLCRK